MPPESHRLGGVFKREASGEAMTTRGLFVGRFQPPHLGHVEALDGIAEQVDRLVIVVGSSQYSHTLENPFTAGERVWMLEEALPAHGLAATIVPVPDIHRNALWVNHVETFVPPFDVCFTNNALPQRLFREAGYEVRTFELVDRERFEGTRVRERMLDGDDWEHLVPDPAVEIIHEIDGPKRLADLTQSDEADDGLTKQPPYKEGD